MTDRPSPQSHSDISELEAMTPKDETAADMDSFHSKFGDGGPSSPQAPGQAWSVAGAVSQQLSSKTIPEERFNRTIFAKIANNEIFSNVTLSIIVINALWIMVDTEWNHANIPYDPSWSGSSPLQPTSTYIENFFCGYFTLEVFIRFLSYKKKLRHPCRDAWFVFDSFLVLCMVTETWILVLIEELTGGGGSASALSNFSALRLLRLLRLTRMARLMRQVPELMVLVRGIGAAAMSVIWILLFLVMVMYVFAIIFTSTYGDPAKEKEEETAHYIFGSMGDSMMTLFTNGVLGDNLAQTIDIILAEGTIMFWVFFVFFCISAMTLLNMLIGVLCEVIAGTADQEKGSMQETGIRMCLASAFSDIDQDHNGTVSEKEWSRIKKNPELHCSFIEAGWDEDRIDEQLDQMQSSIFPERNMSRSGTTALGLEDLCSKVIDIRPSKPASLLDLKLLKARQEAGFSKVTQDMEWLEETWKELMIAKNLPIPDLNGRPDRSQRKEAPRLYENAPTHALLQELKRRSLDSKVPPNVANMAGVVPPKAPPGRGAKSPAAEASRSKVVSPPPPGVEFIEPQREVFQRQSPKSNASSNERAGPPQPPQIPTSLGQLGRDDANPAEIQPTTYLSRPPVEQHLRELHVEPNSVVAHYNDNRAVAGFQDSPMEDTYEEADEGAQGGNIFVYDDSGYDYQRHQQASPTSAARRVPPKCGPKAVEPIDQLALSHTSIISSGGRRTFGADGMPVSRPVPAGVVTNKKSRSNRRLSLSNNPPHLDNADDGEQDSILQVAKNHSPPASAQPQEHPLFYTLHTRRPPGGWLAVRCIAAQLEHSALTLPELSKRARIRTVSDLRALLLELPELFDYTGPPDVVDLRFPEVHVQGCPWCNEPEYDACARLQGCHCVWRICDALQQTGNEGDNSGMWGAMPPRLPPRTKADCRSARSMRGHGMMQRTA